MTCETDNGSDFWGPFYARPSGLTGGSFVSNSAPPSYHAPNPPPHKSVRFSLQLRDFKQKGWWNPLNRYSNQYVIDDGTNIVHRGTLVGKNEDTIEFSLAQGSYTLKLLGNFDDNAADDTWTLLSSNAVLAQGGRYDAIDLTVGNGAASVTRSFTAVPISPTAASTATYEIAHFDERFTYDEITEMKESIRTDIRESLLESRVFHHALSAFNMNLGTASTDISLAAYRHPYQTSAISAAFFSVGMLIMFIIMTVLRRPRSISSTSQVVHYTSVCDESVHELTRVASFELESTANPHKINLGL